MRILNNEQAKALRVVRKGLADLDQRIEDKLREVISIDCGHEEQEKDCPVCVLYCHIRDAHIEIMNFRDKLDQFLLNGPISERE